VSETFTLRAELDSFQVEFSYRLFCLLADAGELLLNDCDGPVVVFMNHSSVNNSSARQVYLKFGACLLLCGEIEVVDSETEQDSPFRLH
jgi:hypothetical protein